MGQLFACDAGKVNKLSYSYFASNEGFILIAKVIHKIDWLSTVMTILNKFQLKLITRYASNGTMEISSLALMQRCPHSVLPLNPIYHTKHEYLYCCLPALM